MNKLIKTVSGPRCAKLKAVFTSAIPWTETNALDSGRVRVLDIGRRNESHWCVVVYVRLMQDTGVLHSLIAQKTFKVIQASRCFTRSQ